ncbi:MAG: ABC transporter ATP-binding protein [Azoarcus sp.]|jgi:ABC-2 type transport system ATP-binding protein|nr:ABC transporter ATP-binding protein [Azoarcus sp.]
MAVPAIRVAALTKRYGDLLALAGIDLEIGQGEFFGLLGPNGAGKTTLISALAGLIRADSGTLEIMGHDVTAASHHARLKLGVVPQELVFDPFFTVREVLQFQSGYFGIRGNDDWIDEILHRLDLHPKANANMRTLSGGMKRRVLVAQALVHRPPVIVLDEPTAGVDVELRQSLWRFVQKLNADGHTVVLTTHYLEEAETLCGRIAMMKAGRIVALDTTANLLSSSTTRSLKVRVAQPAAALALGGMAAGDWVEFGLDDPATVETLLARLRETGAGVREIAIGEPDLERVFVEVMHRA